jgi:hypothetical protein
LQNYWIVDSFGVYRLLDHIYAHQVQGTYPELALVLSVGYLIERKLV